LMDDDVRPRRLPPELDGSTEDHQLVGGTALYA
jgi:hypothetical protein